MILSKDIKRTKVVYLWDLLNDYVGEEPTDLNLHPNSPGYRLILNNILFPAARKKKQKT